MMFTPYWDNAIMVLIPPQRSDFKLVAFRKSYQNIDLVWVELVIGTVEIGDQSVAVQIIV